MHGRASCAAPHRQRGVLAPGQARAQHHAQHVVAARHGHIRKRPLLAEPAALKGHHARFLGASAAEGHEAGAGGGRQRRQGLKPGGQQSHAATQARAGRPSFGAAQPPIRRQRTHDKAMLSRAVHRHVGLAVAQQPDPIGQYDLPVQIVAACMHDHLAVARRSLGGTGRAPHAAPAHSTGGRAQQHACSTLGQTAASTFCQGDTGMRATRVGPRGLQALNLFAARLRAGFGFLQGRPGRVGALEGTWPGGVVKAKPGSPQLLL